MEALFPLLMILVVGTIIAISVQQRKAKLRAWSEFARRHDLRLINAGSWSNPRIVGRWKDVDITLQIEVHGSGKNRKTYTRGSARFHSSLPRGLNITSEGFTDRLAKMLGGQDIQIGHAELDRQLRIKAEDVVGTRVLMKNWRARNAIAAFIARDGGATVTQHQATTLRFGFMATESELRGIVENVARAVREIEAAVANPEGDAASPAATQPAATQPVRPIVEERGAPPPPDLPPEWADLMRGVGLDPGAVTGSSSSVITVTETTVDTGSGPITTREVVREGGPVDDAETVPAPFLPDAFAHAVAEEAQDLPPAPSAPSPVVSTTETAASPAALESPLPAGDPIPLPDLLALEDRSLSSSEQKALVAGLLGRPLELELEVERVSMTLGLDIPAALENGQTVVAKPAGERGPRLTVRFAPQHEERVKDLGYGDHLEVAGVLSAWDEFYRQAVVDVF